MFSQTVEYALRAIVFLAERGSGCSAHEVAEATQTPPGYLAKVMKDLAKAGVLSSHRGVKGGFMLTRPADEISLYDVISAVDPLRRITKCPLNNPKHADRLCELHAALDKAIASMEQTFKETTVAQMIERPVFA